MLKEEQVAELLRRCELIAGRRLKKVRGDLCSARNRASAIWELLVVEAAACLGKVEYEGLDGGPDIRLLMPSGRSVSIEVAYLYPRFSKEERRRDLVQEWIRDATSALGPNGPMVRCVMQGDPSDPRGPVLKLPKSRDELMGNAQVARFFNVISQQADALSVAIDGYTLKLEARPRSSKGFVNLGRSVQESPKHVKEHAVYRVLREKSRQHHVEGPYVVCIGSDVSPSLSSVSTLNVKVEQAVGALFRHSAAISGAIVTKIETKMPILAPLHREAISQPWANDRAREPLSQPEWEFIRRLDLNRWKFTFPMAQEETAIKHRHRAVLGPLSLGHSRQGNLVVTFPAPILVEALAGKGGLLESFGAPDSFTAELRQGLEQGWIVLSCRLIPGDIQQGLSPSLEMELGPPHERVLWP